MLVAIPVVITIMINITILPTKLTNNCVNQKANVLNNNEKYNHHGNWKH